MKRQFTSASQFKSPSIPHLGSMKLDPREKELMNQIEISELDKGSDSVTEEDK